MVEKVLGSEKIGIEENQSVCKHFCNEISFDEKDNKCKIKLPFKELHIIPHNFENCKRQFNSFFVKKL